MTSFIYLVFGFAKCIIKRFKLLLDSFHFRGYAGQSIGCLFAFLRKLTVPFRQRTQRLVVHHVHLTLCLFSLPFGFNSALGGNMLLQLRHLLRQCAHVAIRLVPQQRKEFGQGVDPQYFCAVEFQLTLESALREAVTRRHAYLTVEHLLFALIHDENGAEILRASGAKLGALKQALIHYFDESMEIVEGDGPVQTQQTLAFHRVLESAIENFPGSVDIAPPCGPAMAPQIQFTPNPWSAAPGDGGYTAF